MFAIDYIFAALFIGLFLLKIFYNKEELCKRVLLLLLYLFRVKSDKL